MRVYTISSKRVEAMQRYLSRRKMILAWKEGISEKQTEDYRQDIMELWNDGKVRYWKMADSYVLADDFKRPSYYVYCISREYFKQHLLGYEPR